MIKVSHIAAVALVSAALLMILTPLCLAAAPGEETGPPMGTSQDTGGPTPTSPGFTPSQMPPQGFTQRSQPTGQGMMGQGKFSGPGAQQPYGGGQPMTGQRRGFAGPAGQGQGGPVAEAIVIGVDQPDSCLRIRRGPSPNYEQIGCARLGDKLNLTGVFSTDNRWAQLDNNGWVFACQIKTDFRPPGPQAFCGGPSVGRVWREPATFGRTYIYERDSYRPYWWRHHHHHDKHPKHPKP
jgi:hypothetical protein